MKKLKQLINKFKEIIATKRKYLPLEKTVKVSFFTKSDYRRRNREIIIIVGIIMAVALLTFFENRIGQFSADLPISNTVLLFILFNLNLLLVVLLIFLVFRNLIKLLYDRKRKVMGSRLRTRLVMAFVMLSLLPTIVLFIFSISFISNSIQYWFNAPVEKTLSTSVWVSNHYYTYVEGESQFFMDRAVTQIDNRKLMHNTSELERYVQVLQREFNFDGVEIYDLNGRLFFSLGGKLQNEYFGTLKPDFLNAALASANIYTLIQETPSGDLIKVILPVPAKSMGPTQGYLVATTVLPNNIIERIDSVERGAEEYENLKLYKRPIQLTYIIALAIVAFLVLFCAVWVGFYLAKTISVPIRELAEATQRVAEGNLDVAIGKVGDDEIGSLVNDFNQMISDLKMNRYQLELSTAQLRQQNYELEQRRQYIEIVLENVSAGVMTLDRDGYIVTINKSAENILHTKEDNIVGMSFMQMLSSERYRLPQESLDMLDPLENAHSLTLRIVIDGQSKTLLMNAMPLMDARNRYIGAVVVFDDLTELERGERMAAWREVARRVAHEVKNPLTPISLSAQRLEKKYGRELHDPVFTECTKVIIDHVELIRSIVDEFSNFARFPSSILAPAKLVPIIEESVALYREANQNVDFNLTVVGEIPDLNIDVLRMKQVFINLLDNAIAAILSKPMEGRGKIEITIKLDNLGDCVIILLADNGPGLDNNAKARIFEPNFSTKATGMGLGLTIVNTIIADHKGEIAVVDNEWGGATFIIELPLA